MTENKDEIVAFGKTIDEIKKINLALSAHKDVNQPISKPDSYSESDSYDRFLEVKNKGHNALLAQENYFKTN